MKIGLKIVAALCVAFLVVGCGSSSKDEEPKKPTEPKNGWMLSTMNDSSSVLGTVYLQLKEDGTFNLYQSVGVSGYSKRTGTYALSVENAVQTLSGKYSDGSNWSSSYEVLELTTTSLKIKASTDKAVYEYVASEVPEHVTDGVIDNTSLAAVIPFL